MRRGSLSGGLQSFDWWVTVWILGCIYVITSSYLERVKPDLCVGQDRRMISSNRAWWMLHRRHCLIDRMFLKRISA